MQPPSILGTLKMICMLRECFSSKKYFRNFLTFWVYWPMYPLWKYWKSYGHPFQHRLWHLTAFIIRSWTFTLENYQLTCSIVKQVTKCNLSKALYSFIKALSNRFWLFHSGYSSVGLQYLLIRKVTTTSSIYSQNTVLPLFRGYPFSSMTLSTPLTSTKVSGKVLC